MNDYINPYESTKKGAQPPFPLVWNGWDYPFPVGGNDLGALQCIATIPMYTCYEGEKREQMKKEYEEGKRKGYLEAKAFYEENIFVGMTFYGGRKEASAKITKINTEKGYVYYTASDELRKYAVEQNKIYPGSYNEKHPLKPGKYAFSIFLSAIKQGTIKISEKKPI